MLHILLSVVLVGLALLLSIRRHGTPQGYLVLSWVPVALLVIAGGYELLFGFKRFAEVVYHFAYDTSYILSLVGIMLLLTSVLKRTSKLRLLIALLISAVPIFLLILWQ
jgi:asparagine N-glycosylation enzyme membrane subunit Stt3